MVFIGIDPGKNNGFAVWDCKKQSYLALKTLDFWACLNEAKQWKARCKEAKRKLVICVEDARKHKAMYSRNRGHGNRQAFAKIAQNVGSVKRETGLLIEGLQRENIAVMTVVPRKSKLDAKAFKKMTGYTGRTNEHKRDAGRLVYGMRAMPELQYNNLKPSANE